MVCLDTSVIVALIRKDSAALEKLAAESQRGGATVSTTPISLCELYAGAFGSRLPAKELERVQGIVERMRILEFDAGAARRYGELVNDSTLKRAPIGDFDLIIASIAMEQDERLATRDLRHFARVPGLDVEEW